MWQFLNLSVQIACSLKYFRHDYDWISIYKSNHKGRGWQWTPVMDWRFKSFPCPGFSVWTSFYFKKNLNSFCKARSSLSHDQIWAMPHFWIPAMQNLPCNRAKISWLMFPQRVFRFKQTDIRSSVKKKLQVTSLNI